MARVETDYVGSRIDTTAQVTNYLPAYDLTQRARRRGGAATGRPRCSSITSTNRLALLTNASAINVNVCRSSTEPLVAAAAHLRDRSHVSLRRESGTGGCTAASAAAATAPAPTTPAAPPPAPVVAALRRSPPPPAQELVLRGVNFETASAKLKPESTAILDGVVVTIQQCHCSRVGWTSAATSDSVGKPDYNQKLSERRAIAVKGLPSRRSRRGRGASRPRRASARKTRSPITRRSRAARRIAGSRCNSPLPRVLVI